MLLEELRALDVSATFFVVAGLEPEILGRIVADGHEVGYHCGRHVRHSFREHDELRREVCDDLLWLEQLGILPTAWRTPWGDLAPWSGLLASEFGLELWGWSDDTRDWSGPSATEMASGLEASLSDGSVILMHDGIGPGALRAHAEATVELVAPLVELCRSRGLRPGRVTDDRHAVLA